MRLPRTRFLFAMHLFRTRYKRLLGTWHPRSTNWVNAATASTVPPPSKDILHAPVSAHSASAANAPCRLAESGVLFSSKCEVPGCNFLQAGSFVLSAHRAVSHLSCSNSDCCNVGLPQQVSHHWVGSAENSRQQALCSCSGGIRACAKDRLIKTNQAR